MCLLREQRHKCCQSQWSFKFSLKRRMKCSPGQICTFLSRVSFLSSSFIFVSQSISLLVAATIRSIEGFTGPRISGMIGSFCLNGERLDVCICFWKLRNLFRFCSAWIDGYYMTVSSYIARTRVLVSEIAVPWNETFAVRELGL